MGARVVHEAIGRLLGLPVAPEAARRPELGALSAMAHGEGEQGTTIAAAVLPAVAGLRDDRARVYGDLVPDSLSDAVRRALETMMKDK
ncbi:hypothetical protein BE11_44610 [Sorangium cellulosum]|nr:hypothetical protein BE11_44610 [Sorangium cellulosum]